MPNRVGLRPAIWSRAATEITTSPICLSIPSLCVFYLAHMDESSFSARKQFAIAFTTRRGT
jgi:hypothetical protein